MSAPRPSSLPHSSTNVPPPPPPTTDKVRLIFYVERELLPEEWVNEWRKRTGVEVEQRLFAPSSPDEIPLDGDLYSVSTRWFTPLQNHLELKNISNEQAVERIDPVFQGHAFDLDSLWSRPWRWTPYFIYERKVPQGSPKLPALFPSDEDLLSSFQVKFLGGSISSSRNSRWAEAKKQAKGMLPEDETDEPTAWQALKEGKAGKSLLPASLRLKAPRESIPELSWTTPATGTIIRLEVLAVSGKTAHSKEAADWLDFLGSTEVQTQLVERTGYFSVIGKDYASKKGFLPISARNAAVAVPDSDGSWFSRSEYLQPLEPKREPIVVAKPVAPAPEEKILPAIPVESKHP